MTGNSFEAVIGLEVHAQLLTRSKIFCGCSTDFGDPPNSNICPTCAGLPGALPVFNHRVLEMAAMMALVCNCRINMTSAFARKHYFYPDLPKGYQITQHEIPFAVDGFVELEDEAGESLRIGIEQIHMEEDSGKLIHEGFEGSDRFSRLDLNRCGVALLEIVTRPDLRTPGQAARCLAELRAILRTLGICDGNMEEGSLRCDANVSVRPAGSTGLGVKTETKNMNSIRHLRRALEYEIERQTGLLRAGSTVRQESRAWDPAAGRTVTMRGKEEALDYRYFPDPDLPPVQLGEEELNAIRQGIPELPLARRNRFVQQYGIPRTDAAVLTRSGVLADYFEETVRQGGVPKAAANWIMGDLLRELKESGSTLEDGRVTPSALAELTGLINDGTASSAMAKEIFVEMFRSGDGARDIIERSGLRQITDRETIEAVIRRVLADHPGPLAQYRAGKTAVFGFFVGQVMKAADGQADPGLVNEVLKRLLDTDEM